MPLLPTRTLSSTPQQHLDDHSQIHPKLNDFPNVKRDYGAAFDGTTDDTTAWNNAIADVSSRGGVLVAPVGISLVPAGITESKQNLTVIGATNSFTDPAAAPSSWGTVLKTTTTGAWCWTHNRSGAGNDSHGPRMEGLVFLGDADTAGGFRSQATHTRVHRCTAVAHTTGIGFLIGVVDPGDDASWSTMIECMGVNNLTHFKFGVAAGETTLSNAVYCYGCFSLNTTAGGILDTGTGFLVHSPACQFVSCKGEQSAFGWDVTAHSVQLVNNFTENNGTRGVRFNKDAAWSPASRNKLVSHVGEDGVEIGANEARDQVWAYDAATTNTIVTDNGSETSGFAKWDTAKGAGLKIRGGEPVYKDRSVTATLDFGSITGSTSAELTVAMTGAAAGDECFAMPSGAPEAGLAWSAFAGTNVITVRLTNATLAPIDPASRTWRVTWRQH